MGTETPIILQHEHCDVAQRNDFFNRLVMEGAHSRYGETLPTEVSSRLQRELDYTFELDNLVDQFLLNWFYARAAKEELRLHVGPGRGGNPSSLINYCLHVTEIDPLQFNLPCERCLFGNVQFHFEVEEGGKQKMQDWASKSFGHDKTYIFTEMRVLNNLDMTKPLPLDDADTLDLFKKGRGHWFKDCTSREALRELNTITFDTLVDVYTIVRPLLLDLVHEYVRRSNTHARHKYLIAEMAQVLDKTQGLLIYQEQTLQLLDLIAGIRGAEAEEMRKSLHNRTVTPYHHDLFIQNGAQKGHPLQSLERLWTLLVHTEPRLYLRSHTISQTLISYHLAYAEAHQE